MPAVIEAKRKGIQLVLLTADRDNYLLQQGEDQLIPQNKMFGDYTVCDVNLPIVRSDHDLKYCIRKCNEALIALTANNNIGPVQINFQVNRIDLCRCAKLPQYRKVEIVKENDFTRMQELKESLLSYNRIMVILGQDFYGKKEKIEQELDRFYERYNAIIVYEETSNLHPKNALKTCLIAESMTEREFKQFCPDLVITIGMHIFSFIKYKLRNNYDGLTHWRVTESEDYLDNYDALRATFRMRPIKFLQYMNDKAPISNHSYDEKWKKRISDVKYPELGFSNYYVVKKFCEKVPDNSLIHLSILNSVRLFNFNSQGNTVTFSNLGADGIDGCMPTFLGEAEHYNGLAFLVTGDLSYLYALNTVTSNIKKNIRILLINNHAGGEFHNNFGVDKIPTLRDFISAGHSTDIRTTVSMGEYEYLTAKDSSSLASALELFVGDSECPILLEVFTDADFESNVIKKFYEINQHMTTKERFIKNTKIVARKILFYLGKR